MGLQGLREGQGLSRDDLARRSGLPNEIIGDLESGRLRPGPGIMMALASGLGVSPSTVKQVAGGGWGSSRAAFLEPASDRA